MVGRYLSSRHRGDRRTTAIHPNPVHAIVGRCKHVVLCVCPVAWRCWFSWSYMPVGLTERLTAVDWCISFYSAIDNAQNTITTADHFPPTKRGRGRAKDLELLNLPKGPLGIIRKRAVIGYRKDFFPNIIYKTKNLVAHVHFDRLMSYITNPSIPIQIQSSPPAIAMLDTGP